MNYRSNRRIVRDKFNRIENDQTADIALQAFEGMHRVLKDNSHIYVFCSWHHIDKFKAEFERWFTLKNVLVWNKNNHGSGDLKGAYAPKHEFILFGHKGRRHLNRRIPDVIDAAKVPSCHLTHPTEKPQSILTALIENSSRPGDIVFDPFMGTASTMIAADAAGRNGIGIEKDGTYFETARQRIEAKAA